MRPTPLLILVLTACASAPVLAPLPAVGQPAPAAAPAGKSGTVDPDTIVAAVDGQIILLRSILKEVGPALAKERDPKERLRLMDGVILQLIRMELHVQAARRLGLKLRPGEVKRRLEAEQNRAKSRGLTLEGILAQRGITLDEYKAGVKRALLMDTHLRSALGRSSWASLEARPRDDAYVRPSEVQEYYREHAEEFRRPEEVRLRTIFVKDVSFLAPGMEMSQAHRKAQIHAEGIRARIEKGDDFESLAREFSEDPHREKGGDQGLKTRKDLPEFLREWAFSEAPGTVSRVLETGSGFLIARIEERMPARTLAFEEVQKHVKEYLREARFRKGAARVLLDLVETAEITPEYYKDRLRAELTAAIAKK